MLTTGQILPVVVEKPAAGGSMIARVDGQVVLVAGAIPGERVRARIDRVGKGVAYAQTVDVDEASPDRRAFTDPSCGGCLYGHISYPRQLAIKSQVIDDAFRRIGRLPLKAAVSVAASPEHGYRMRARLHVRGGRLGFFREGTHDLCDVRQTGQLLPAACDTLDRLQEGIRSLGLDGVRELELAENVDASERVVFADAATDIDPRAGERLAATAGLTGFLSAFGSAGEPHVVDRIAGGVTLRRHVLAFFQGNRHLLADFVSHVVDQVPPSSSALDLYAGVGLFALSAAAVRGARVTAVEGDRYAAADLAANASAMAGVVSAVHQSVEDYLRGAPARAAESSVVIADPPRTGMSPAAVTGILALKAARIVYVSCDIATLARDARRMVDAGWAIDRIDAFDLFPNTPHVETVVVFTRL